MALSTRSMSPTRILRALLLTLFVVSISPLLSSSNSFAGGNFVQKTDAEAGCSYGTKSLTDWKMPDLPADVGIHSASGYGIAPGDPCYVFFIWNSEMGPSSSFSTLFARENKDSDGMEYLCSSAKDPACDGSKFPNGQLRSLAGIYKCESENDRNCIAQLLVTDPSGNKVTANFERHFPDAPTIPASNDPSISFPKGGSPTLWSYQTSSGKQFIHVTGVVERSFQNNNGRWGGSDANFSLGINAVKVVANKDAVKPRLKVINYTTPEGKPASRVEFSRDTIAGLDGECRFFSTMDIGECLVEQTYPEGYRFGVVLQFDKDVSFFLNGRLDAPIAYTEPLGTGKRVIIEGAPATLFAIAGSVPKNVLTSNAVNAIKSARFDFPRQLGFAPTDLPPMETRYPDLLPEILPFFGDKATRVMKAWSLKSSRSLGRFTQKCYNESVGEILGIVSTNASAFNDDPPTLDPATNTLSYKVSAPHFAPDGKTENIGRYYMNMNSKFTQCILGVERVPDVATVGITYGQGKEMVSTVSVKQDKDWLRLQADNFTYSAPEIKVSFKRLATVPSATNGSTNPSGPSTPSLPSTTNSNDTNSTPAKSKSITCMKGKKNQVISGINPKCPKGWKKK